MKMMEILKVWIRSLVTTESELGSPALLRKLVVLARATQEYYTSGGYKKDDLYEQLHPVPIYQRAYDLTIEPERPEQRKIEAKYNLQNFGRRLEFLADDIESDIEDRYLLRDGRINYKNTNWNNSELLQHATDACYAKDLMKLLNQNHK